MAIRREDDGNNVSAPGKKGNFAETSHALRMMESVAVCAPKYEPVLFVGNTGEY